jgi:hypothetical protein
MSIHWAFPNAILAAKHAIRFLVTDDLQLGGIKIDRSAEPVPFTRLGPLFRSLAFLCGADRHRQRILADG